MNKKYALLALLVLMIFVISSCSTYKPYEANANPATGHAVNSNEGEQAKNENTKLEENTNEGEEPVKELENILEEILEEENKANETLTEEKNTSNNKKIDIIATEGDLIDLKPFVIDPDGDNVTIGFTAPFDKNGVWQTKIGDAGFYSLIVTATDNKDSFVTKQIKISVLPANRPPVINIADTLTFKEGDLIKLNPDIYDEDKDEVVVTYSGWMNSSIYQSNYDDAGEYKVKIKADDSHTIVTKDINIVVKDVNRKPVLELLNKPSIKVVEGDLVEIKANAYDPDGNEVTLKFSEPLDSNGKWKTKKGDAGTYELYVTASDGANTVKSTVLLEVLKKNEPPVIDSITVSPEKVVLKKPGDTVTIKLDVKAHDEDGDKITLTYSGFMDSAEKVVKYGEKGGTKKVIVKASDGKDTVSKEISFEMNNWPCFDCQLEQ